jgi:hypothetical protein
MLPYNTKKKEKRKSRRDDIRATATVGAVTTTATVTSYGIDRLAWIIIRSTHPRKARRGHMGPSRTRTSRRASSLASRMDHAGPSTVLASTMDLDCFTSCAGDWPPCPLRSEKGKEVKSRALPGQGLQDVLHRLAHGRTMLDPQLPLLRLRTSTASHHAPGADLLARCEA